MCNVGSMTIKNDLTNQKFGYLTVIRPISQNNHGTVWECRCKCGETRMILGGKLKSRRSCGCRVLEDKSPRPAKLILKAFWDLIVVNAQNRNLEFTISAQDIENKYLTQNKKCALSGVEITLPLTRKAMRTAGNFDASLDRIDSSKGYTPDNIQWVHKIVNQMKSNHSEEEFVRFCKLIAKNQS